MWIFKLITDCYCKRILDTYQKQADEKTYKGKEAKLLMFRNHSAEGLIESIKKIEHKNHEDYSTYFKQVSNTIALSLNNVSVAVKEYNLKNKTEFSTDLYEQMFSSSLSNFMNSLYDLLQNSPSFIVDIQNESLFCNNRNIAWIYQFSFVLYEYILEKEFELTIGKGNRDIFDTKKQLVLKYIKQAVELYSKCDNEDDIQYKEQMSSLLQGMRSQEHDVQQRRTQENNTNSMYSYFSKTFYKASEKLIGKGQLGQIIDFLIKEFNERTSTKGLVFN